MVVGDRVRVTASPKEIGILTQVIRGQGSTASVMVKLNRPGDGPTHVIVFAHELEPA